MNKHKPIHKNFEYDKAGKALRKLLNSILKEEKPSYSYKGPEILSSSILAADHNILDSFSEYNLEYDKERGRDVLDVFIRKVYQLGYSVGRELDRTEYEKTLEIYRSFIKDYKAKENGK